MRIEEIKMYIADDGKEFDNEKDCIKYEGTAYTEYMLKDIPHKLVLENSLTMIEGSCCYCYLFVYIDTKEHKEQFEEWCDGFRVCRTINVDVGGVYVIECPMTDDFSEKLEDVDSANWIMSIGDFTHKMVDGINRAEHYVKHEFGKENAK